MTLRVIFMGTPEFSVPTLLALHEAGHDIVACYSQPPRPAGRRGLDLVPSPVHQAAEKLGIPVYTPTSLKGEREQTAFAAHNADVAVVVAYGLLLPQFILDAPQHGCFNGHASLLPRWRGAAPIHRAIMAGDKETGMMIMKMDIGLDTGPIAETERVPITNTTTAGSLHDQLSTIGARLMVNTMKDLERGTIQLTEQSNDAVEYARKISKDEARIEWSKEADFVRCHINGLSPFPGAWCEMDLGGKLQRVKVLQSEPADGSGKVGEVLDDRLTVACGSGAIRLLKLQRAGSKQMNADEFLRGNVVQPHSVIS